MNAEEAKRKALEASTVKAEIAEIDSLIQAAVEAGALELEINKTVLLAGTELWLKNNGYKYFSRKSPLAGEKTIVIKW